jgi:hypothetical protein
VQCIPGSQQECPEEFGNNDDDTCFPSAIDCPDDHHTTDDDKTGQCYPNKECEEYNPGNFEGIKLPSCNFEGIKLPSFVYLSSTMHPPLPN